MATASPALSRAHASSRAFVRAAKASTSCGSIIVNACSPSSVAHPDSLEGFKVLQPPDRAGAVGQQAVERAIAVYARLPPRVNVLDVGEGGVPALLLEDADGMAALLHIRRSSPATARTLSRSTGIVVVVMVTLSPCPAIRSFWAGASWPPGWTRPVSADSLDAEGGFRDAEGRTHFLRTRLQRGWAMILPPATTGQFLRTRPSPALRPPRRRPERGAVGSRLRPLSRAYHWGALCCGCHCGANGGPLATVYLVRYAGRP